MHNTKAAKGGGKVISTNVSLQRAICPECGRSYVSGGTTSTKISYPNEQTNPYARNQKSADAAMLIGSNLDLARITPACSAPYRLQHLILNICLSTYINYTKGFTMNPSFIFIQLKTYRKRTIIGKIFQCDLHLPASYVMSGQSPNARFPCAGSDKYHKIHPLLCSTLSGLLLFPAFSRQERPMFI